MLHDCPKGSGDPFYGELGSGLSYDGTMGDAGQAILEINLRESENLHIKETILKN